MSADVYQYKLTFLALFALLKDVSQLVAGSE